MRNALTSGIIGIIEKVSFSDTNVNIALVKFSAKIKGSRHTERNPKARGYVSFLLENIVAPSASRVSKEFIESPKRVRLVYSGSYPMWR